MRITDPVRRLVAYTPGEQPRSKRVVKLNTNENPYPPSPRCAEVLAGFDPDRLRRYPDPEFAALRAAIAKANGTEPDRVFVGNGSDEILSLAARAFVENDEKIGSLDPSYSLYKTLAAIRDVPWTPEADDPKVSLFLLTNPNAPTGVMKPVSEVAACARRFRRGVLLVDEAYADFASGNCMKLATAPGNRNVIVMRTFSKSYSLAGMRVGYCIGPKDLIGALYKVKDSYNVDAVAQAVALAAFKDRAYHRRTVAMVVKTRGRFAKELGRRGWDVLPSETHVVFAKPPAPAKAADVFEYLKSRDIYVRYVPGPLTGDRIRITIGTDGQMKTLLDALDDRFSGGSGGRAAFGARRKS
ncbi:MAG: aminotransferase class I/II-fold pyridoxal phosphate-dependent enzyme [Kiritimatiellae bacterium]|nr:aminotransferase class I/II-fold pyridoxal phosphate-dependent enzyme [Kiritimatiellia bacterium]